MRILITLYFYMYMYRPTALHQCFVFHKSQMMGGGELPNKNGIGGEAWYGMDG